MLIVLLCQGQVGFAYGQLLPGELAKVVGQRGYSELQAKITASGSIRIIVTLEMPFVPKADPASKDTQEQISRIASLQDALLTELAPYNITGSYKFTYVPQLVMTVNGPALRALLASTLVRSVQKDVAVPMNMDLSVPRIGALSVWAAGYKGAGIATVILSTGVDGVEMVMIDS
jgi:hypothetical protein